MEPSGADRESDEGDERAIYPVRRHVPTGGQNSRKSPITMGGDGTMTWGGMVTFNRLRIFLLALLLEALEILPVHYFRRRKTVNVIKIKK